MRVVVTGGGGYIGSHLLVELLERGDEVLVVDSFVRGHPEAVARAERLAGRSATTWRGDLLDRTGLRAALVGFRAEAVVHCAAFKAVGESVAFPERYERNNTEATAALAEVLRELRIGRVVYASTGSVYGDADRAQAIPESAPLRPKSPYAATKAAGERLLAELPAPVSVVSLRFFNVCGAHPSAGLGEYVDAPLNLVPILLRELATHPEAPALTVFGTDWPTPDGSCVRDYVHVRDIATGLVAALDATARPGFRGTFNLGTGTGSSVLRIADVVEQVSGRRFTRRHGERRPGDPAVCVADPTAAARALGWTARYDLHDMVDSAWRWTRALVAAPLADAAR